MKKNPSFLSRYKLSLITLLMMLSFISIAVFLSFSSISSQTSILVNQFNAWIRQHTFVFLLSHGLLMIAIYVLWGNRVDALSMKYQLTNEVVQKVKQARLVLIGLILIVDILTFCLG
jgi:hypothetical protein